MGVHQLSRYSFTVGYTADDKFQLSDREPLRFKELADTITHTVLEGDTLFTLAAANYAGLPRPAGLWWVIADFQPSPIIDPTLALSVGRLLFIPSVRTVTEDVFSSARRDEAVL